MKLFVCGGGTGGHFFSGVAVAEKFLKMHPSARVIFVGTPYGIEARTKLDDPRMQVKFVLARGVKGRGVHLKLQALLLMVIGFIQSLYLLLLERPQMVWGVGGYASVPTVLAALFLRPLMRWRVCILEQNSYAGVANRVFLKLGARAFSAFPCAGFELVDLPLRSHYEARATQCRKPEWPPKTVLVIGGSQGASGLNQKWMRVLLNLKTEIPDLRILHQTGAHDFEAIRRIYNDLRMLAEVFAFSNDMPSYYEQADLLICRSGAMTVFEAMLFKRPAIFVPFPKAADDHQRKNALSVQHSEWVVAEEDFDSDHLLRLLRSESPKIPSRASQGQVSWESLLAI